MSTNEIDLIVVGGGAAGFFGALACAETHPGARIVILERGNALLSKVKVSGGGRCNVTHRQFDPARMVENYPRGGPALRSPFSRFQARDTVDWFERHGVALKSEPDGRMFPATDSSQTIIDCFLNEAGRHAIDIQTRTPVESIQAGERGFDVQTGRGTQLHASCVLLASGGERGGFALAERLGHTIITPVPSLFTFKIQDARIDGLPGLSVQDTVLRLETGGSRFEQRGPLLITHWGISGPAVLKLSAWAARALYTSGYQAKLRISWLPGLHDDLLQRQFQELKNGAIRRPVAAQDPNGRIPARLWKRLVQFCGIEEEMAWQDCSKAALNRLVQELFNGNYVVTGKGEFKDEFVTCGGVDLKEVNFKTMESRIVPGLYFAGEVLDIDGITGGFNFQSAWTTSWNAGNAIAQRLNDDLTTA